jgi:hypothetical protein
MNTLAARFNQHSHYPIPHADYLRLQHAHHVGVLFLDMLDAQTGTDHPFAPGAEVSLASVVAMLTDQLGKVVATCESVMLTDKDILQ